jgi:hypothetical protein
MRKSNISKANLNFSRCAGDSFLAKGFMPPRPSGHLALGSTPFELKSPDE